MNKNYSGKPVYDLNCKLTKEDLIYLKCIDYIVTQIDLTVVRMNKGVEITLKNLKELKGEDKRDNYIL